MDTLTGRRRTHCCSTRNGSSPVTIRSQPPNWRSLARWGAEESEHGETTRLYVDRTSRGHCHYCHPCCYPVPRVCPDAREGSTSKLLEQYEAAGIGRADVRAGL